MNEKTGAIVAAARIKKWGFAPMLATGGNILIRRIVMTLKSVGISPIVVVTGSNDERLRETLSYDDVTFVYNENHRESQLIESVRLGWEYLAGKCGRFLIARADIPLFSGETVEQLLQSTGKIAIPVYHGTKGHPILICGGLAGELLSWQGGGGLRESICSHSDDIEFVSVEDTGIQPTINPMDAQQNGKKAAPEWELQVQVKLKGENVALDEKMVSFLMRLDTSSTLEEACAAKGITESYAIEYIENLERHLGVGIIAKNGKYELTPAAHALLTAFEVSCKDIQQTAQENFNKYFKGDMDNE